MPICLFEATCIQIDFHTYTHSCTLTYMSTCLHTYIHTYIQTQIHTYTDPTHTHILQQYCTLYRGCTSFGHQSSHTLENPSNSSVNFKSVDLSPLLAQPSSIALGQLIT